MSLHSVNADQRVYVLTCGNGYTCIGFDVAFVKATKVAEWCGVPGPAAINVGTPDGYRDYTRVMQSGADHARVTGTRCNVDLIPAFVGHEGKRVKVTPADPSDRARSFYIGKSAGWMPFHLEISRRGSYGGPSVYLAPGDRVTFTGKLL